MEARNLFTCCHCRVFEAWRDMAPECPKPAAGQGQFDGHGCLARLHGTQARPWFNLGYVSLLSQDMRSLVGQRSCFERSGTIALCLNHSVWHSSRPHAPTQRTRVHIFHRNHCQERCALCVGTKPHGSSARDRALCAAHRTSAQDCSSTARVSTWCMHTRNVHVSHLRCACRVT